MDAFFMAVRSERLFCLLHEPAAERPVGAVIYVHPFAEEMNKSRRMAALQARALADAGYVVLQVDLSGCGDSSGDFGDVSWDQWIDDLVQASAWLDRYSDARLDGCIWWWGLRAGALLAAEAARRAAIPCRMLFWQPVANGKQFLQQFLRLKIAGEMFDGAQKGSLARIKDALAAGDSVEIAGYTLSPGIAAGLGAAELSIPDTVRRVLWMELSPAGGGLLPASISRLEAWKGQGVPVESVVVAGPAFWLTTEISESPDLIRETTELLAKANPS